MALLGLDIGTTGCKAHVFDNDLYLIASAKREYPVEIPHPSWAEQDAERVWKLAKECIKESIHKADISNEITAIGLSVQGEAITPVDKGGNAIRATILGMDTRTDSQNNQLRKEFGAEKLFKHTGMPVHTINTLPKLLWIKENEKDIWNEADKFLLYEDFVINKLTGTTAISKCLASRTQLYDLENEKWSEMILDVLELDLSKLADVFPSGTNVGPMRKELAEELGFSNQPIIATGGHDQACGALGAGLVEPGLAMVSTGTAEVVEVAMDAPHLNQTLYDGNMSIYQHTFPGLYVVMTLNQSGGFVLRWFRDTFCEIEMEKATSGGEDAYDLIFQDAEMAPSPIMILPHFFGSGTPFFDTQSKGAVVGLTFATTKTDFAKAIIEALTMELRLNLEILQDGGILIDELRAIGGGAKSELWLQLKADITGIPVTAPEVTEAAGMGAAVLGGVAAGIFSDLTEVIKTHLKIKKVYKPNLGNKALFDERYAVYKKLYPTVKEINRQL